jgi:hypothetical protein
VRFVWGNVDLPWVVDKGPSCLGWLPGYPSDFPFFLRFFRSGTRQNHCTARSRSHEANKVLPEVP